MSKAEIVLAALAAAAIVALIRALALAAAKKLLETGSLPAAPAYGGRAALSIRKWLRELNPRIPGFLRARLRPDDFPGLPLTLLALGAIYVAALLAGLIHEVIEAEEVLAFDERVNSALAPLRKDPLIGAFLWITALGAGPALAAVASTATAFLWAGGRRSAPIFPLWTAFLGAQLTTWAGKYAIDRHRPEFIEGVSAMSPSFPSGHSTGAMAVYGFLAYALARDLPGWRPRFEVVFWAGTLIALIGFSRIYLSVHYLTDVVGGFLVGGFWLLVAFAIAEWRRGVHGRPRP